MGVNKGINLKAYGKWRASEPAHVSAHQSRRAGDEMALFGFICSWRILFFSANSNMHLATAAADFYSELL